MRIMQLLGSSAGGVSQHVAQVARLLDDAPGLEVIVASPGNLAEKFSPITQHRTVEITDRPSLGDARVLGRIKQLVADVDVVHAHGLRAGAMAGIALGAMARSHRPKLVVTLHNPSPRYLNGLSHCVQMPFSGFLQILLIACVQSVPRCMDARSCLPPRYVSRTALATKLVVNCWVKAPPRPNLC
jgi:hypothetical protein